MRTHRQCNSGAFSCTWSNLFAFAFASLLTAVASANDFAPLSPFKSLCIEDAATGFSWKNGNWRQANFKEGRFVVSKLTNEEVARLSPVACTPPTVSEPMLIDFRRATACYAITGFGEELTPLVDGENCDEVYQGNVLASVRCKSLSFLPNGDFIKLPWHANISRKPMNDYKDSLVLSIGVCSKISQ